MATTSLHTGGIRGDSQATVTLEAQTVLNREVSSMPNKQRVNSEEQSNHTKRSRNPVQARHGSCAHLTIWLGVLSCPLF